MAWCVASEYLFYLVPDELHRPFQVWRHRVGTPAGADALVFEEPDERFELTLHSSRSGELAVITAASRDTTEVRVIALQRPLDDPVLVEPRQRGIEYRVDHARAAGDGQGTLYIVTDSGRGGVHADDRAARGARPRRGVERGRAARPSRRPETTPGSCAATCWPTTWC